VDQEATITLILAGPLLVPGAALLLIAARRTFRDGTFSLWTLHLEGPAAAGAAIVSAVVGVLSLALVALLVVAALG
jgi:hypothetical protein